MPRTPPIKFLTYYGYGFTNVELKELVRRIEQKEKEKDPEYTRDEGVDDMCLVETHCTFPEEKASFEVIEKSWRKDKSVEERLRKKRWLIHLRVAATLEDPGLKYDVEEELSEKAVEWLKSLGYSDEELEELKIVIPGVHFEEARDLLLSPKHMEAYMNGYM
ncbi:hypothetical protein SCHPADRAFT_85738 [Schizopora paradoxa]|uniref:Uncharacterized protein n=1 Tax=Schizopora paradoxa TaxID=27342 RepID=A0A0H2SBC7_9AGAM|nr:hypothetical protein SCHPADRAFT_85738 [Schizopora paradoxa]